MPQYLFTNQFSQSGLDEIGHWERDPSGDRAWWVVDRANIDPLSAEWKWWRGFATYDNNSGANVIDTSDLGNMLSAEAWATAGYTGPLLETTGSGDGADTHTSSALLDWMVKGDFKVGQGYEASTGLTVDQLFQGQEKIGDPYKFAYNDNAFAIAALAAGAVVAWAAVGAASAGGAGAGAAAADAGITLSASEAAAYGGLEAAAVDLAAGGAGAFAGGAAAADAGITLSASEAAAYGGLEAAAVDLAAGGAFAGATAGASGELAAADAFVGASGAASGASSLGSAAPSIVDTIGSAIVKAAGSVLAPVATQALGAKINDALAPDAKPTTTTYQPIGQAAPGASLVPVLLIAGAVALAFVAFRKST